MEKPDVVGHKVGHVTKVFNYNHSALLLQCPDLFLQKMNSLASISYLMKSKNVEDYVD